VKKKARGKRRKFGNGRGSGKRPCEERRGEGSGKKKRRRPEGKKGGSLPRKEKRGRFNARKRRAIPPEDRGKKRGGEGEICRRPKRNTSPEKKRTDLISVGGQKGKKGKGCCLTNRGETKEKKAGTPCGGGEKKFLAEGRVTPKRKEIHIRHGKKKGKGKKQAFPLEKGGKVGLKKVLSDLPHG